MIRILNIALLILSTGTVLLFSGCGGDDEANITTTISLTFTPTGTGAAAGTFDFVENGNMDDIIITKSAIYSIDEAAQGLLQSR